MKISIFRSPFLVIIAISCQVNWASAADYEVTFTGNWRNSDDIVVGWDWTLPAQIRPADNSGIFNLNTSVPPDFPGNHLKQVNAIWSELEPTEGNYDFSSIIDEIDDPRYDGIMLNVRGMVVAIEDFDGVPLYESEISAPSWLSKTVPLTTEDYLHDFRITNMNIYHPRVTSGYIRLIQALGRTNISRNPKLKGQIIHGVSKSRGEEWTGEQANRPEAVAAMEEIIIMSPRRAPRMWGIKARDI